jgi:hypothetical protein
MLDDRLTVSMSWIDSHDRQTGEPTSRHEATDDELRDLMAGRAVPAATSADGTEPPRVGRADGGESTSDTYDHDALPPPRFRHDPAAGVFRLTAPDGPVGAFRDRPAKSLFSASSPTPRPARCGRSSSEAGRCLFTSAEMRSEIAHMDNETPRSTPP